MYLDKLEIRGFGKFENRTIRLTKGINIIYGHNEAGKTTLQWYIKGMLYGMKNGRQARNGILPSQKRFEPWSGGQYGGSLEYTLDDGSSYRIERDFESVSVRLFDSSFNDITNSFSMGKDKMPLFAERHLGIDEAVFERTVLIRQSEIRIDGADAGLLAGKIANVSDSGDEDISYIRAEKVLTEALKSRIGTGRTTKQPLDKLEARLGQLESDGDKLRRQQEQKSLTRQELQKIREDILLLEKEEKFLDQISKLVGIRKSLDINLRKETGLKEAQKQLDKLKGAEPTVYSSKNYSLSGTFPKVKKTFPLPLPLLWLAAAAAEAAVLVYTIAAKLALPLWIFILIGAGIILSSTFGFYQIIRYREKIDSYAIIDDTDDNVQSNVYSNIYSRVSILCGKQINTPGEIQSELGITSARLEELSGELDNGIAEACRMECGNNSTINRNNIETKLYDHKSDELELTVKNEAEKVKENLLNAALKEKYYEGLMKDTPESSDELQRVEEETFAIREKIEYLKHMGEALRLAHEVLQEAAAEIKRTYTPGLNRKMSEIIAGLTGKRYRDLRGDDKLSLMVAAPENGDVKSVLSLSGAAADQMYLALRLAMAELLIDGKEKLPILMDEVFSQFDDKNTAHALKYLYNTYEKNQVLIFTCKEREVCLAREIYGSSLNMVEL